MGETEVRVPLARGRGGANNLGSCVAAGTGFAHPAAEPRLPAFSRLGSLCGIPAPSPVGTGRAAPPPGIRALVGAWFGAAGTGRGRRGARGGGKRGQTRARWALGLYGHGLAGEPEPCTPTPEMGVPERLRQRRERCR